MGDLAEHAIPDYVPDHLVYDFHIFGDRAYAADPQSQANNVTALVGREGIRLRVGDWRVIMHDGEVLDVLKIGPRGGVYD